MSDKIRILLADDHPIFRRGLRAVLQESPFIEVVAEADDGPTAIALARDHRPDVVVLDFDMPGQNGLEVTRELAARQIEAKVVLLTAHKSAQLVARVLEVGPLGFVLKDGVAHEIVDCVRAVHGGRHYVSPQLSSVLMARRAEAAALAADRTGLDALTPSERRVLALVAQGRTTKEIADTLCVSTRTIDHHRAHIAGKLGLTGSHALVKFAVANRAALT